MEKRFRDKNCKVAMKKATKFADNVLQEHKKVFIDSIPPEKAGGKWEVVVKW
jgi:hypothetical protein